jgi:hypothetical protein
VGQIFFATALVLFLPHDDRQRLELRRDMDRRRFGRCVAAKHRDRGACDERGDEREIEGHSSYDARTPARIPMSSTSAVRRAVERSTLSGRISATASDARTSSDRRAR